jgi:hypothetical protein
VCGERLNGEVVNATFLENLATQQGGGVFLWKMAFDNRLDFTNAAFWRNHTSSAVTSDSGGAIYLGEAGALDGANAKFVNCTVVQNYTASCGNGTALFVSANSIAAVHNSIVYFNHNPDPPFCGLTAPPIVGPATVGYSDVQQFIGGTNIMVNPMFINYNPGFDLRLTLGSDCIDHADYLMLPKDNLDVNDDGIIGTTVPIDLIGSMRFVDDPGSANNGVPSGADWLDMGAYERP